MTLNARINYNVHLYINAQVFCIPKIAKRGGYSPQGQVARPKYLLHSTTEIKKQIDILALIEQPVY